MIASSDKRPPYIATRHTGSTVRALVTPFKVELNKSDGKKLGDQTNINSYFR